LRLKHWFLTKSPIFCRKKCKNRQNCDCNIDPGFHKSSLVKVA
jgi:hypothetical protein